MNYVRETDISFHHPFNEMHRLKISSPCQAISDQTREIMVIKFRWFVLFFQILSPLYSQLIVTLLQILMQHRYGYRTDV